MRAPSVLVIRTVIAERAGGWKGELAFAALLHEIDDLADQLELGEFEPGAGEVLGERLAAVEDHPISLAHGVDFRPRPSRTLHADDVQPAQLGALTRHPAAGDDVAEHGRTAGHEGTVADPHELMQR